MNTSQPPCTGIFILNKPPRPNSWWAQATLPLVKSLKLSFLLGKCGRKYPPHLSHTAVVRIQWVNRLFIYVFFNRYLSKAYSVSTLLQSLGVLSEQDRRGL